MCKAYQPSEEEYVFCLVGDLKENTYRITSLEKIQGGNATKNKITFEFKQGKIPCQGKDYLGTLHKHPRFGFLDRLFTGSRNNGPSKNDMYTFGLINKPIHVIQWDHDKFYAAEYPLDLRAIPLKN